MKKIKLLTSLVGLTGLTIGLVPVITGCSCSNGHEVTVDSTEVNFTQETTKDGDLVIKLTPKSTSKQITGVSLVKIGDKNLTTSEYTYSSGKVTIKKEVLSKYSGKITIKPIVKDVEVDNSIPLTTEFYTISEEGDTVRIKSFSQEVQADPTLLSKYDSIKISDYKTFTTTLITGFQFSDPSVYQNITKITFNTSSYVNCLEYGCEGFPFKEVNFGSGEVLVSPRSFATLTTATIEKVIVSPKTKLNCKGVNTSTSPFAGQISISTIDVSSFTTENEINDASWINSNDDTVWSTTSRADSGKIIISDSSLEDAWKTKFAERGLTVDGTNWVFEVKK